MSNTKTKTYSSLTSFLFVRQLDVHSQCPTAGESPIIKGRHFLFSLVFLVLFLDI